MTVVSDVHAGHEQIHVSHGGLAAPTLGTPIDGDELPNDVEIPDGQKSLFVLILEILGDGSDGGLTDDLVSFTDDRRSIDHGVRTDQGSLSDGDAITNDGIGSDSDSFADFSTRRNNGGFVDFTALFLAHVSYTSESGRSTSENKISASATR